MTKRTHLVLNFFGAVLLLGVLTNFGYAQTDGEISCLVTDPLGASVSSGSVSITHKATGAAGNVTTNSEGLYD